MTPVISPILLAIAFAGVLAVIAIVIVFCFQPPHRSRLAACIAVTPSLLMLALFYSLAINMHHSLGAWSTSIGERGFPASLLTHCAIATNYFSLLALFSIFIWPIAFLACALVPRWRGALYYLGLYACSCALCIVAMQFARLSI